MGRESNFPLSHEALWEREAEEQRNMERSVVRLWNMPAAFTLETPREFSTKYSASSQAIKSESFRVGLTLICKQEKKLVRLASASFACQDRESQHKMMVRVSFKKGNKLIQKYPYENEVLKKYLQT